MNPYNSENNLNNYIEYFSIKSINHKITLTKKNPFINNIICDNYYVNFNDFNIRNNKIIIKYFLEFKILYSSLENNKTYTLKNVKVGHIEIFLPNKINGEYLEDIFLRKGFTFNLKNLSSSIINFNKNSIFLYFNLLGYIEIFRIHFLAYIIEFSDFEKNIYTSLFNGQDLIQKSFESEKMFKSLKFSNKNNYLFYLEEDYFITNIIKLSLENDDKFYIYRNSYLKNYEIFDDKNLLLLIENINEIFLILFNIETFKEKLFFNICNFRVDFFKITKNFIVLILNQNNKKFLNIIDKSGNLICKIEGDFFCCDISPCEKFLLLSEENTIKILFLNSKEIHPLNYKLSDEKIIDLKFLSSKKILVHIKRFQKEYLITINLSNNKKEILIETNFKIIDFSIDYENSIVYYILKGPNICKVNSINEEKEEKNLINLDAKNLSLTVRS